jgi:hypothetical protein
VVEGPGTDLTAWSIAPFAAPTDEPALVLDDVGDLGPGDPARERFAYVGGDDLDAWRADVARWAESPSAPIDPTTREAVLDAARVRDWAGVLTALRACTATDGSRFETYAWADRILAVDLAADVGR